MPHPTSFPNLLRPRRLGIANYIAPYKTRSVSAHGASAYVVRGCQAVSGSGTNIRLLSAACLDSKLCAEIERKHWMRIEHAISLVESVLMTKCDCNLTIIIQCSYQHQTKQWRHKTRSLPERISDQDCPRLAASIMSPFANPIVRVWNTHSVNISARSTNVSRSCVSYPYHKCWVETTTIPIRVLHKGALQIARC